MHELGTNLEISRNRDIIHYTIFRCGGGVVRGSGGSGGTGSDNGRRVEIDNGGSGGRVVVGVVGIVIVGVDVPVVGVVAGVGVVSPDVVLVVVL